MTKTSSKASHLVQIEVKAAAHPRLHHILRKHVFRSNLATLEDAITEQILALDEREGCDMKDLVIANNRLNDFHAFLLEKIAAKTQTRHGHRGNVGSLRVNSRCFVQRHLARAITPRSFRHPSCFHILLGISIATLGVKHNLVLEKAKREQYKRPQRQQASPLVQPHTHLSMLGITTQNIGGNPTSTRSWVTLGISGDYFYIATNITPRVMDHASKK